MARARRPNLAIPEVPETVEGFVPAPVIVGPSAPISGVGALHPSESHALASMFGLHPLSFEQLSNGAVRCLRDSAAPVHGYRFFKKNNFGVWCEV